MKVVEVGHYKRRGKKAKPNEKVRRRFNEAHRQWMRAATRRARRIVKPGRRVSRTLCAGRRGTFTFTHWEGEWMCGSAVTDCHALNVLKVDGRKVDFGKGPSPEMMMREGRVVRYE